MSEIKYVRTLLNAHIYYYVKRVTCMGPNLSATTFCWTCGGVFAGILINMVFAAVLYMASEWQRLLIDFEIIDLQDLCSVSAGVSF